MNTKDVNNNKKATQLIIESIQEKILTGELRSGQKLPPERKMAEQLEVNRHTLREVLSALSIIGILDSTQGSGNYITEDTMSGINSPLSMLYKLGGGGFKDIIYCRFMIESQIIKEICSRSDDLNFDKLENIVESTKNTNEVTELSQLDLNFHKELIYLGNNLLIKYFYTAILSLIEIEVKEYYKKEVTNQEISDEIYDNHFKILTSLKKGDSSTAMDELLNGYKSAWTDFDFDSIRVYT